MISVLSLSRVCLCPSRSLLSGHRPVLWLLGSRLHRTYLLDGLILTSYFCGLVVWWCLMCFSLCPSSRCGLACRGSWDGSSRPGQAARSPALPPNPPPPAPPPPTPDGLQPGKGSHSHIPVQVPRVPLGRETRPEARAGSVPMLVQLWGLPWTSFLPHVSDGTVFSPAEVRGTRQDDSAEGPRAGMLSPPVH